VLQVTSGNHRFVHDLHIEVVKTTYSCDTGCNGIPLSCDAASRGRVKYSNKPRQGSGSNVATSRDRGQGQI
jgi:hypothetical protein